MYVQQPLTVAPPEIERRIEREEHDEEWAIEEEWTNGEKKKKNEKKKIDYWNELNTQKKYHHITIHIRLKYP